MSCQFSASQIAYSHKNVVFSKCGQWIGRTSGSQLTIHDANTLSVVRIFNCVDVIERIEFSPDSEYILCALFARNCVQIFCVADSEWRCRINESVAGMVSASWCPDSRHIIVESDFGIQLAIWSLLESTSYLITSPKTGPTMHCFSDCHR